MLQHIRLWCVARAIVVDWCAGEKCDGGCVVCAAVCDKQNARRTCVWICDAASGGNGCGAFTVCRRH